MDTTQMLSLLAANSAILVIYAVVWIIANWKLFTKANEAGWKSIIPWYNVYTLYKFTWNTMMFWVYLAGTIVSYVGSYALQGSTMGTVLATVGVIVVAIVRFLQCTKESKAFGHGTGFALGLFFITPIFVLILAFGSSKYQGAQD